MVSSLSFIFMIITLALSVLLPLAFLLILIKGRKGVFSIWIAGALGFFIPQMIIRIPILQFLGTLPGFKEFAENQTYLYIFLLALTAGLFETAGRLVVLKVGLGKRLSFTTGLAAGAGHGAMESIGLIGLTYVNNLIISVMINSGALSSMIPDEKLAESVRKALTGTAPDLFLAAGLERIFTMVFHIAMSVLLCYFIMKSQSVRGFGLVLFLHFAVDFAISLMQVEGLSTWVIEGAVFVVALLALTLVFWIRPRFADHQSIPPDAGEQAVQEGY